MPCCSICKKEDDNPVDYGEFMNKSEINVHYFCLLLSTHLPQNGQDCSGILGFLLRDIRNEIKKCEQRVCCYCKQSNASIACFKCKQYFHNVCGNENNCVSEFNKDFRSYCHDHVPFRRERQLKKQNKTTCWICEESLGDYSPIRTLRAYCCQNGYVHRYCIRKYALNAGYRLICIWCTSKNFRDDIRKHGVFVPDREAIWDNNETLRYTDLHRGYSQCDAKTCLCPQGRDYFRINTWNLMVCFICGASGVHEKCGRMEISKNKYTCETCREILQQTKRTAGRPRNVNSKFNYTMFISKTYDEKADLLQIVNCNPVESEDSEDDVPTTKESLKNEQTVQIVESSEKKSLPQVRELAMFGKNSEIIGQVKVNQDKLVETSDGFVCKEEDILEFSTSNKLLKSIFSDIEAEGRELSMDMVDEVFDRFKLSLETFGVDSMKDFSSFN